MDAQIKSYEIDITKSDINDLAIIKKCLDIRKLGKSQASPEPECVKRKVFILHNHSLHLVHNFSKQFYRFQYL